MMQVPRQKAMHLQPVVYNISNRDKIPHGIVFILFLERII
jgi:hypothetical protein